MASHLELPHDELAQREVTQHEEALDCEGELIVQRTAPPAIPTIERLPTQRAEKRLLPLAVNEVVDEALLDDWLVDLLARDVRQKFALRSKRLPQLTLFATTKGTVPFFEATEVN